MTKADVVCMLSVLLAVVFAVCCIFETGVGIAEYFYIPGSIGSLY